MMEIAQIFVQRSDEDAQIRAKAKRNQFKKNTWNDMYNKRIEYNPRHLTLIIWVQSRFRQAKARRIVYKMLTEHRMKDLKY